MVNINLITYGCTANQDNSAIIKGILTSKGHNIVESPSKADIIIINTCIVKGVTANKVRSAIGRFRHKRLIITGCMAESEQKLLKKIAPNASLVNTFHITEISSIVNSTLNNKICILNGKRKEEKLSLPKIFKNNKAIIQISEGCTSSCTFCETKLAKGHITSYPEVSIVSELKNYIKQGHKFINITSTDNGCYGLDIGTSLPALLKRLVSVQGSFQLRIGMMNPQHVKLFLKDLIDVYKSPKIIKFLHIPLQSGSNKVLKEMNRHYTTNDFKHIINEFRKSIPGISISTDIIVGYPTENEKDFNQTIKLIKETKPDVLNISKFAPRPRTRASKLKQLPTELIKDHSRILTKEFKKIKKKKI